MNSRMLIREDFRPHEIMTFESTFMILLIQHKHRRRYPHGQIIGVCVNFGALILCFDGIDLNPHLFEHDERGLRYAIEIT